MALVTVDDLWKVWNTSQRVDELFSRCNEDFSGYKLSVKTLMMKTYWQSYWSGHGKRHWCLMLTHFLCNVICIGKQRKI